MFSAVGWIYVIAGSMAVVLLIAFTERFKRRKEAADPINRFLADTAGVTGSLAALFIALIMNNMAEARQAKLEDDKAQAFRDQAASALADEMLQHANQLASLGITFRNVIERVPNAEFPRGVPAFVSERPMFESIKSRLIELSPEVRRAVISYEPKYSTSLRPLMDISTLGPAQIVDLVDYAKENAFYYHCALKNAQSRKTCDPAEEIKNADIAAMVVLGEPYKK